MPELPEVESLRLSLLPRLLGRRVEAVDIRRADIIEGDRSPAALLQHARITSLLRHGKQLAIVTDRDACLCIHLGMTGSLRCQLATDAAVPHTHILWHLDDQTVLQFRDPRRFGGLWTHPSLEALQETRWSSLGPDALTVTPRVLLQRLSQTRRALKAALLDQGVLAGLGNIYADELLHTCELSPLHPSGDVTLAEAQRLVTAMRTMLRHAIRLGGSTLRDYADAQGCIGSYQARHKVYSRGGEPCLRCGAVLQALVVAGRTTVHCARCQR